MLRPRDARRSLGLPLLMVCCVLPLGCASQRAAAPCGASATETPTPAERALAALLDEDLDARALADPVEASVRGDRRYDDRLPDVSPEALAAQRQAAADRLRRLRALDRSQLSEEAALNAQLLERTLTTQLDLARFHPEWTPITQQQGPHIDLPQLPDRLTFPTRAQLEAYLRRLEAIPRYLDQTIANMRAGLAAGITPPRVVMRAVPEQAKTPAQDRYRAQPREHPLFAPFADLPAADPLAQAAARAIADEVVPAFSRLAAFLEREYVPNCRETVGLSALPDGADRYRAALRAHTTTTLAPQRIHEIGLAEVARIRAEMFEAIARTDFARKDELSGEALLRAFVEWLRTDPRFYYDDPQALLRGYRDICKRMDAELPRLFGVLPRLPYGVRPMPAFMAQSAPTAYYYPGSMKTGVAGHFVANTTKLDQRPKYEMTALALHEAVPGHHLQIALKQELEERGLHPWRSVVGFGVFTEGWALYAERLGLEAGGGPKGFYSDPYDDFGRLSYEMWRALRLVVDTGIHALGWSREQAIDYMLANSALSRANVVSEVDRYIAWPGQACSYKLGELAIRQLRAQAEEALGERFDRRAFHDALLEAGDLPLNLLRQRMRVWIRRHTP